MRDQSWSLEDVTSMTNTMDLKDALYSSLLTNNNISYESHVNQYLEFVYIRGFNFDLLFNSHYSEYVCQGIHCTWFIYKRRRLIVQLLLSSLWSSIYALPQRRTFVAFQRKAIRRCRSKAVNI